MNLQNLCEKNFFYQRKMEWRIDVWLFRHVKSLLTNIVNQKIPIMFTSFFQPIMLSHSIGSDCSSPPVAAHRTKLFLLPPSSGYQSIELDRQVDFWAYFLQFLINYNDRSNSFNKNSLRLLQDLLFYGTTWCKAFPHRWRDFRSFNHPKLPYFWNTS